ncbi:MAG: radical SAM protein [candidate division WOR-3 bacterium]
MTGNYKGLRVFKCQCKYLRISLTDRRNLRCRYCMPAFGVKFMDWEKVLTSREILRLAKIFKELGISKVRLTGGEPLLRWDLREIVEGLKELNLSLNITTNGILLDNYLDFLKDKVDYLYKALEKGFKMVKINTVIANGFNDDKIFNFVEFAKEKPVAIGFIEFKTPFMKGPLAIRVRRKY